jgi:hypothetical protein
VLGHYIDGAPGYVSLVVYSSTEDQGYRGIILRRTSQLHPVNQSSLEWPPPDAFCDSLQGTHVNFVNVHRVPMYVFEVIPLACCAASLYTCLLGLTCVIFCPTGGGGPGLSCNVVLLQPCLLSCLLSCLLPTMCDSGVLTVSCPNILSLSSLVLMKNCDH